MEAAALDAWGRVSVEGVLRGGARSVLLRVSVAGRACVARRVDFGELEARWLQRVLVAAAACGLVVAPLIASGDGRLVSGGWTVEPLLEGEAGQVRALAALAPVIRRFHARTAGFPERPGQGKALRAVPEALCARVRQAWPDGRTAVVHGDLHPGNLIRRPDGRLALIDWEEARRDAVGVDLGALRGWRGALRAHAAVEVAACWGAEPARGRAMARLLRGKG